MRQRIGWTWGGVLVSALVMSPVSFADVPSTSSANPQKGMVPGNIPATGDEDMAKMASVSVRGKLTKSEGQLYTVETGPNKQQVQLRASEATKFEDGYKGAEGDWIEAWVTPDMHLKSLKKSTPAYTMEGQVLRVDGNTLIVRDMAGKETRLQTGSDTKMAGSHKVGESIRIEYSPEGQVLSIKPAPITRGEGGG